jgi:gluconate 2-dehydrogenase gamma chain
MFTPTQAATLRAAADRIIPPDDFPGGSEGIEGFLEALAAREGRDLPALYAAGLDALGFEAEARGGAPIAALDAAAQDALLAAVEAGAVQGQWPLDPAAFFATLAGHVIEAYYSDPGNGGNPGARSWEMVGFVVKG